MSKFFRFVLAAASAAVLLGCGEGGRSGNGADAGPGASTADAAAAGPDARSGRDAAPSASLPVIDFRDYHDQGEIADYLRAVADARPDHVTFESLGASFGGREIAYVVIDYTDEVDPPAIFLNGTHHGDERSSTETTLGVIDYLLREASDPDVAAVLEDYAIYVLPLVNPDGHADQQRGDRSGRDPNRDYAYPGRSDAESFHLPEIQLIKQLQDAEQFHAAIAYHSGITLVLWPWCSTGSATDDHNRFYTLAKAAADAMGFDRYLQSWFDYPTSGEYIDYAYMRHRTLAVTFEVSDEKTPPSSELAFVVERAVDGTMAFLAAVHDTDSGAMAIEVERERALGAAGAVRIVAGEKLE